MKYYSIAIDGPGGAGKSTIAKLVAKELEYTYIDTGAMYRAVALYCQNTGVNINDKNAVENSLKKINITMRHVEGEQHVFLNGKDISNQIRIPEISKGASIVACYSGVRDLLALLQREMSKNENIVMDGRDIGTNVLPNANLKIYLDASVAERARRRLLELKEKADFESVKSEIMERDYRDMNREYAPLRKAVDAIVIDSSDMTLLQVKEYILDLIRQVK